jgi:hypothetical protein
MPASFSRKEYLPPEVKGAIQICPLLLNIYRQLQFISWVRIIRAVDKQKGYKYLFLDGQSLKVNNIRGLVFTSAKTRSTHFSCRVPFPNRKYVHNHLMHMGQNNNKNTVQKTRLCLFKRTYWMLQKNLSTSRALYGDCYPILEWGGGGGGKDRAEQWTCTGIYSIDK